MTPTQYVHEEKFMHLLSQKLIIEFATFSLIELVEL